MGCGSSSPSNDGVSVPTTTGVSKPSVGSKAGENAAAIPSAAVMKTRKPEIVQEVQLPAATSTSGAITADNQPVPQLHSSEQDSLTVGAVEPLSDPAADSEQKSSRESQRSSGGGAVEDIPAAADLEDIAAAAEHLPSHSEAGEHEMESHSEFIEAPRADGHHYDEQVSLESRMDMSLEAPIHMSPEATMDMSLEAPMDESLEGPDALGREDEVQHEEIFHPDLFSSDADLEAAAATLVDTTPEDEEPLKSP